MKKFMVIVLMAALVAGCGSTSEQRIAAYKQGLDQATAASRELDLYLPQVDGAIAASEAAIAAGLPADQAAKMQAKIDEAKKVKAQLLAYKAAADKAALEAQAAIAAIIEGGGKDFSAELQAIGAVLTSAGAVVPPPAGPFVTLGGVLVGIIGGIFGGIKSQKKYKTGLVDVVKSVNAVLDKSPTDSAAEIKETLKTNQSNETQTLVREINLPKAA
jgi:hypothetical protein